jgi:two-component system, chemotaxis family, sensor kinase CheA
MTGENAQYLQIFIDESQENIQLLNTVCLRLEETGGTDEDFAEMFRAAHTLKGMSATMGFEAMAHLTHRLEDTLSYMRANPERMSSEVIDVFFQSIDALETMLSNIQSDGTEGESRWEDLIQRLQRLVDGREQDEVAATMTHPATASVGSEDLPVTPELYDMLSQLHAGGLCAGYLRVKLAEDCIMKGPRAIMVVRAIDGFGDILSCHPSTEEIEAGSFDGQLTFLVALRENDDSGLLTAVRSVSEVAEATWKPWEGGAKGTTSTQAAPKETSGLGEANKTSEDSGHRESAPRMERAKPGATTHTKSPVDRTIRVPVERLDTLMNLLSELVIDKTRLAALANEIGSPELKEVTDKLSRVANDLQSSVMALRMVPVEALFQRFPRMVRDLSRSLGKDIRLEMSGLETEFDRTVIDEMGEVLVHLIRNAADHGLEQTDRRLKAGKPAHGTIQLRAYGAGQHVFIEVQDDGGGIDTAKVLHRAMERGLITASEAERMTQAQIHGLLFESGFSTADRVSDISGRGVGLDAVKSKVESLGGRIHIESVMGEGTTFRIQLPLTLSILQALLVQISGETLAIPLGNVEEVVAANESDIKNVHGRPLLCFRDKLIPILDAGQWLFGDPALAKAPWHFVICKSGHQTLAVAVHGLYGQQEIVNKSLGAYLQSVRWFSGATILGNGQIALIADVHAWMNQRD